LAERCVCEERRKTTARNGERNRGWGLGRHDWLVLCFVAGMMVIVENVVENEEGSRKYLLILMTDRSI
jgi:hypothetical protein